MIVQRRRTRSLGLASRYLILALGAVVLVTPFAFMVSVSLKGRTMLLEVPPRLFFKNPTLDNYVTAWTSNQFGQYFVNSLGVAVATTVLTLLLSSMMAYGFARFRFRGRGAMFTVLILGMSIPGMLLIVPQFLLAKDLQLLNSLPGLLPFYVGGSLAFNTFLLRAFFERIPRELDEAMEIDGAGPWRRYWNLALPLARPALATTAIFTFLGSWDEFAWALTVINDVEKRTLPIGIALFTAEHGTQWGLVFAASVIAVTPVILVYILFQRQIISGLTNGAIKS
ncbi:MAG: carbohydrate ABC transporter permease [Actinobacteria bacterium]|nr:carbohydrate ABC transporter permease [Actinomycetota bacterium]